MSLYDDLLESMDGQEYSDYFAALCPFHDDHHPSLMVYQDGFHCLACNKRGSLKFLAQKLGRYSGTLDSKHTVLPRWRSWEEKYESITGIAQKAHKSLLQFSQHQYFFKKRKIDHFIEQGMFGYLDGWVLFPILDQNGRVVDIVVRDAGNKRNAPRYVLHPDDDRVSPYLYVPNWHRVLGAQTVFVPFGMIDAWAFEDIGLPAITGTSGKAISVARLKELQKICDCQFVFVPDKGEEREAYNLANKLGWRSDVFTLYYPEGCKDPDDVKAKYRKEHLLGMIQNAVADREREDLE